MLEQQDNFLASSAPPCCARRFAFEMDGLIVWVQGERGRGFGRDGDDAELAIGTVEVQAGRAVRLVGL